MNSITNTSLNDDQKNLFDAITTKIENIIKTDMMWDNITSLIGPAGTGKTYLTTQIVKYFLENKDILDGGVCVTAPTHKAVSVLSNILRDNKIKASSRTIHSFLGIKPFQDFKTGEERFTIDKT